MPSAVWQKFFLNKTLGMASSDPGSVINIADPMTGTFVFIKLAYLKNFMSNECSMKCLQDLQI